MLCKLLMCFNLKFGYVIKIIDNIQVADSNNVCVPCHNDCKSGKCAVGNDSTKCLECSSINKYLLKNQNDYGNCV